MSSKKEEKKNLNYIFKPSKDFSFRNDEINDENENPNKTISSSSSKKKISFSKETNKFSKNDKTKKVDLLNQLIINRLVQENKFLKEEIEIAKSNILIFEEKESQYKNTIDHINIINKEKEISYKNLVGLINNYKQKENELNYNLSLYSKELIKKNKIINQLNTKINEMNEQIIKLKNIIAQKNKIINYYSRNKKLTPIPYDVNLNNISNHCVSKSLNIINHNKKESDAKLHYREKTLSNLNFDCDFNNMNFNNLNKKQSNDRINTINTLKLYGKLNNNDYIISDNNSSNFITEESNHVNKLTRKNSAYKKIPIIQTMKKNNSYKIMGYNSVNSTINKNQNQNSINSSINLIQYKKDMNKKSFKNLKLNSDKRETNKMIMLTPNNRYLETKINKDKDTNANNKFEYNSYSYIPKNEENYLEKKNNNNNDINKNKKGYKYNKKYLFDIKYIKTNENTIPSYNGKNENKNKRKIELNKYFINNTSFNQNSSFRNFLTERDKIY